MSVFRIKKVRAKLVQMYLRNLDNKYDIDWLLFREIFQIDEDWNRHGT